MPSSPEEVRRLLCALGSHIRESVGGARGDGMAEVAGRTTADTVYWIDRVADEALIGWFSEHWRDVLIVSEGFEQPVVVGGDPAWTVIVDPIDGTRSLMYDKRPAWCLAAAAPLGGSLRDVVAAAMTELPVSKQGAADQLSAVRGHGLVAERVDLVRGERRPLVVRASSATDLEHSFASLAKFFLPGKAALATIEAELFSRLGAAEVFDDQYISTGGQLYEIITGHDRFVADLRPLINDEGLVCHPYDVCTAMLLEEAGGVVTDESGGPLDARLDTTSPVAWIGYANEALAELIGPVLAELIDELRTR